MALFATSSSHKVFGTKTCLLLSYRFLTWSEATFCGFRIEAQRASRTCVCHRFPLRLICGWYGFNHVGSTRGPNQGTLRNTHTKKDLPQWNCSGLGTDYSGSQWLSWLRVHYVYCACFLCQLSRICKLFTLVIACLENWKGQKCSRLFSDYAVQSSTAQSGPSGWSLGVGPSAPNVRFAASTLPSVLLSFNFI